MKKNKSIFLLQNYNILFMACLLAGMAGCKKQVEVDAPLTNPASSTVYTSDATAAAVMTTLYAKMAQASSIAQTTSGIEILAGLAADELQTYSPQVSAANIQAAYKNTTSLNLQGLWKEIYSEIYITNAVIEGIEKSKGGMTDSVKNQLTGEAKFMRAFLHFYVINLFGDAPYITTTDYKVNAVATRTAKQTAYDMMVADLKAAKDFLPDNYVTPTGGIPVAPNATDRVRPNKWTATAMLARVYLYKGEWANAETESSAVINNTAKFSLVTDLTKVFLKDSKEIIWSIQPVVVGQAALNTPTYNLTQINNAFPVTLKAGFLNNFETGDKRRNSWIDSATVSAVKYYVPGKYKQKSVAAVNGVTPLASEYYIVFRISEQYLLRAEARAQQDKVTDAKVDLNAIRTRAGLGVTAANDKPTLLSAIEKERQVELFTEMGHRWLDLKRTGRVDAVMTAVLPSKAGAGAVWDTRMQLWPIPTKEILLNPNLAPQNPGYN